MGLYLDGIQLGERLANTKQLPPEVLEVVAGQIGDRLGIFPNNSNFFAIDVDSPSPTVDLGETFEMWSVTPDALEEVARGVNLETVARQTGIWHHQVRSNREARSFARSRPLGATPDSWSLRELFVSPLAEQMSSAIDWIEKNAPAELEARYLSLPPLQVDAFWLLAAPDSPHFDDWNDKIVIIRAGASSDLNPLRVMSSQQLFNILREEGRGAGLR
jgi:hypothetical protein